MWGLGAIRDGAAGLVKQGAGAVKHGVEAGAKLLENLDEVWHKQRDIPHSPTPPPLLFPNVPLAIITAYHLCLASHAAGTRRCRDIMMN